MENNNIIDVNETDFETKVLEESSNRLVVVDFWAPDRQKTTLDEKPFLERRPGGPGPRDRDAPGPRASLLADRPSPLRP